MFTQFVYTVCVVNGTFSIQTLLKANRSISVRSRLLWSVTVCE